MKESSIDKSCIFAVGNYCRFYKMENPDCDSCDNYENFWDDYRPTFDDEWSRQ